MPWKSKDFDYWTLCVNNNFDSVSINNFSKTQHIVEMEQNLRRIDQEQKERELERTRQEQERLHKELEESKEAI